MKSKPTTFIKSAAAGNDFIIFDNRNRQFSGNESGFFQKICRRRFGIGADGVILIETSDKADFSFRYFNSDGRPAAMCGNGARAVSYYLSHIGQVPSRHKFEIGGRTYDAFNSDHGIRISMPQPKDFVHNPFPLENSEFVESGYIHVGVPHLILYCRDIDAINMREMGPKFRHNPHFPDGANVNFVRIDGRHRLTLRTYERGVEEETMACGTGAVASAAVTNLLHRSSSPIDVQTRGGPLQVSWENDFSPIFLAGTVEIIYTGELLGSS